MEKLIVLIPIMFLLLWNTNAAVPHLINYQGKLADKEGKPLDGVSKEVTFRIYDAEVGNGEMPPWQETHQVNVEAGGFSVILGSLTPFDLPFDKPYFLEIQVGDEVMSPRQQLTSVGYAMMAKVAQEAKSLPKGVIIMCKDSCPSGYRRIGGLDGKFLTGGVSYNSNAGGSNTQIHEAGSYKSSDHSHDLDRITVENVPNGQISKHYSVTVSKTTGMGEPVDGNMLVVSETYWDHGIYRGEGIASYTEVSGGGSIVGTSASADNRPEFATVVLCEKE